MYFSIDQAVSRIEKQLRKYKEKIQQHKPSTGPSLLFKSHVIENVNKDSEFRVSQYDYDEDESELPVSAENSMVDDVTGAETESRGDLQIVRSTEYQAAPMNLDDALMQIELQDRKFLVFTNAETDTINVLYFREDGKYGLIETGKHL
ncbi:HPF/RaiA family ribosome-associated protein [Myxococcota bacterium]|nr:HPF/RaiA family ribosome-associated protein [Myxococcota bacterium]MBU1534299.1 HPF/RaiA family ribosome-associated protein [Myxococcota bacterium]